MTETTQKPAVGKPLGVLESTGLIRLATTKPELEYLFRHVLVQDAAYESLLKQERRRLHVAVAEAIEALHPREPGAPDALAGMLAWHYDSAGEADLALGCYIRAGEQALRQYALDEAYSLFGRARDLIPEGDTPEIQRSRVEAAAGQVRAGWFSHSTTDMRSLIEPVVPLAEALGDKRLIGQARLVLATVLWHQGELYEPGTLLQQNLDRALAIADEIGDTEIRGVALTILGRSSLITRDPKRAVQVLEEGFELTKGGDYIGASMAANTLAMTYGFMGDFDKAEKAVTRAVKLAEDSGDPIAITDAGIAASMVQSELGDLEKAVEMARASAVRAAALNAPMCTAFSNLIVGTNELKLGRYELATPPLQLSNDLAERYSIGAWANQAKAALSSATCAAGNITSARDGWDLTIEQAKVLHDPAMEGDIRVQRVVALQGADELPPEEALAELDTAIGLYEAVGARPRVADAQRKAADLLERLGRTTEAAERRRRADELRTAMGLPVLAATTSVAAPA